MCTQFERVWVRTREQLKHYRCFHFLQQQQRRHQQNDYYKRVFTLILYTSAVLVHQWDSAARQTNARTCVHSHDRRRRLRVRAADFMIMLIRLARTRKRAASSCAHGRSAGVLSCCTCSTAPDRRYVAVVGWDADAREMLGWRGCWQMMHSIGGTSTCDICVSVVSPVYQERYTTLTFEIECHSCSGNWDVFSLLHITHKNV